MKRRAASRGSWVHQSRSSRADVGKARLTSVEGDDPVALLKQKVQRIYARQAKKDANVVSAIDRGAGMTEEELDRLSALPEEQLRAAGWTPRRLQIARRGLMPKRDVPFALSSAPVSYTHLRAHETPEHLV